MQISKQPSTLHFEKSDGLNLKSLDALRGFLALYVVAGHCRWLLWTGYGAWLQQSHPFWQKLLAISSSLLRYGHEAVVVFFVLSGFFIHLRFSNQAAKGALTRFNFVQFIRRRCHRLIPPYAFALGLTILFDVIGMLLYPTLYQAATGDTLLDVNFARKGYSLESVVPALFLLPSSSGQDFGSNGPFWSLAYEMVYYAIYPVWLLLRKRSALLAYATGLGLAVLSRIFLPYQFVGSVLSHYPIWLCGAALAELFTRQKATFLAKAMPGRLIAFSGFTIAFVGIHISALSDIKLVLYAILGSSIVVLSMSLPASLLSGLPFGSCFLWAHNFFESLGLKSYTIYICHFPMVTLLSAWSIETQGSRPSSGWLALSGFVGSLLLCNLCFYLCERRFLHARIKLSPQ